MKVRVETANAPKPIGAYSQAVKAGDFVFISGQIPLDPETGELVEGGAKEQAARVLDNLEAILKAAGSTMNDILKLTVFLADLEWFSDVNEVLTDRLGGDFPAREVVEVARLPKGAGLEVSAIAAARE